MELSRWYFRNTIEETLRRGYLADLGSPDELTLMAIAAEANLATKGVTVSQRDIRDEFIRIRTLWTRR